MITSEERQSIINEAVEKALLALPEVVGNLIVNQTNLIKTNRKFYGEHPEFTDKKDVVAAVVEKVEGMNPGLDYDQLLEKAVPLIRQQIGTVKRLDTVKVGKPNRDMSKITLEDHGEL